MGLFYRGEIFDLFVSFFTISLAFSLFAINFGNYQLIPIIFLAVGLGFVVHELSHRFVAIHFGCHAFYKAWTMGLVFALMMAVITGGRFIFAAPGAVYIYKANLTRREDGIISLAGPFSNFVLSILFVFLYVLLPQIAFIKALASWGFTINIFLGLFNLLPIPPLDGSKVAAWSFKVWAVVFITMLLFNFWLGFGCAVELVRSLL